MFVARPDSQRDILTQPLWNRARLAEVKCDPNAGFCFEDHFLDLPLGRYLATAATAGTLALDPSAESGVALLDSASTTAGQGVTVTNGHSTDNTSSPTAAVAGNTIVTPAADATIFFEARVKAADIATGPQFMIGLTNLTTAPITGGATAVVNTTNVTDAIALTTVKSNDGGNDIYTYHDEAGETHVVSDNAIHTFVDGEWVNLGCIVDGTERVLWFVNGAEQTAFEYVAGSGSNGSIPTVPLTLMAVCQTDGTTDPILHLDIWRLVKLYRKELR